MKGRLFHGGFLPEVRKQFQAQLFEGKNSGSPKSGKFALNEAPLA
jgi:hypothetical protein